MKELLRFFLDEQGPTAVEYAVMLAMLLVLCISAIGIFGQQTAQSFDDSRKSIEQAFRAGN